jgi:hypothetical protein
MSAPNYALDISLAKGANAQAAVLNLGTDVNIILDGNLAAGGDIFVAGTEIELAAATSVGAPVQIEVVGQSATGQTLQLTAGGPSAATSTASVAIGTSALPNMLETISDPVLGNFVFANANISGQQFSSTGGFGYALMPCPVTVSGNVANFTPAGPNGPLVPGLYAILIGPGTDAGANAQAYTAAIAYLDSTGAWAAGGSSFTSPQIEVVTAAVNGYGLTGCFGTRLTTPPSNQMVFLNGANFNTTLGQVNIYFRCLFTTQPGVNYIPPFSGA